MVHQTVAIMYCTQQMIQGENFRDWLKNRENRESFPLESFAIYGINPVGMDVNNMSIIVHFLRLCTCSQKHYAILESILKV